jgi:uncharacterized protein (TIGR02757 family)
MKSLLKEKLDTLYATYDRKFLNSDPLSFVHQYTDPADKEVVGLVCAILAYGNVKMIRRNLESLLALLGPRPAQFARRFDPIHGGRKFSGFSHRFTKGNDIILLLYYMKQMLETSGSIGEFFRCAESDGVGIRQCLTNFVERVVSLDCSPLYPQGMLPNDAGIHFLFPSPSNGSACKRLNLYLRWMVRCDDIDLGLWRFISPAHLVIPLDTHVARICGLIGLTARKSPGWAMAEEITENLKMLDPHDPVKYDFAISRLGILAQCPKVPVPFQCLRCELQRFCTSSSMNDFLAGAVANGKNTNTFPQSEKLLRKERSL